MSSNLVIVESPAKAKTIKKYLGKDFHVIASYGHVRNLLSKKGAVDTEKDFAMQYVNIEKNEKHIKTIIEKAKASSTLYLATDPDREGEAIAWHIYEILNKKKLLKDKPIYRIAFHEITKKAITEALENCRQISMDLVNAQQARSALDYLIGFNLSPLLWKKITQGLSAGRVQSPALRIIVEREEEIEQFKSQEYWSIDAELETDQKFKATLIIYKNEELKKFTITNEEQAKNIKQNLLKEANSKLKVTKITKKQFKRYPAPPFITSTLQQESARKLGFSAKKTMRVAQQLYEGIKIGTDFSGLISYMRTDSVNLAEEAISDIRTFILKHYGEKDLPEKAQIYKTKSKNAQEAHEAIRPTSLNRTPESIKEYLNEEQIKLYSLIWKRTVACQMIYATLNTTSVDLACGENSYFRTSGTVIIRPGFLTIYKESKDDEKEDKTILPHMAENDLVDLNDIEANQHFTEPPPRFSEASLIKLLEKYGIGRPSTYATIIHTIQSRNYAVLNNKRFIPTDVGRMVNKFLTEYFKKYVDYEFTANLEDELDAVSRGENARVPLLKKFWIPFKDLVDDIDKTVKRKDVTQEILDEKCPKCGKNLSMRLGRYGKKFIGCTGYPDCNYIRNIDSENKETKEELIDRLCPECNSPLQIKTGRFGNFIGCTNYPKCKYIEPLNKPEDTNIKCPMCEKGNLLKRKSRRGKIFYSCSKYPKCKYALWNEPISEKCPKCDWPILTLKITKKDGAQKICPEKNCV